MKKRKLFIFSALSFLAISGALGIARTQRPVAETYAKTYDKDTETCTHNQVQITNVTKTDSRLNISTNYKNDGVVKGSTGVDIHYPKVGSYGVQGTGEVTLTVVLEEARTVDVYWLFQKQGNYSRGFITIKHDETVIKNDEEINVGTWNIDHVECHAGTNTLKYACRYQKTSWAEIGAGRHFYVLPSYLPTFDENDRCTQCGIQCSHSSSSMHSDDTKHWYQCDDLCRRTFETTLHDHIFDEQKQCIVCGMTQLEKDGDYYLISNPAELATFTKYVNVNGLTDIKARLTSDLNLNGVDFEPIGNGARIFIGEFDGNNHRIYNLNLVREDYSGAALGFFGVAGSTNTSSALIKNLTIDESCYFASNKATAALVGYIQGNCYIDHCGNEANVSSLNPDVVNSLSAGLVAFGNEGIAHISYSYNTGTIVGGSGYYGLADDNAFYYTSAGLVGYVQALNVDHSYNAGQVTVTLCENDGKYDYVTESIHTTSFGNAFGAAGAQMGEYCFNYEAVSYGESNEVAKYSSLTDGTVLSGMNNGNTGTLYTQGEEYPILVARKAFANPDECHHHYTVSRYEWSSDYSSCKGIATCDKCGEALVEIQPSAKTIINVPNDLGLVRVSYTAFFTNAAFINQKTLVEYKIATTHTVTLNSNGGNGTPLTFYYEGIGADLPYDYIKDGHYVEGWYLDAEFTGEKVTKISPTETEDKVFYAKYEEHVCSLTWFEEVSPTCTEYGHKEGQKCIECGAIREGGEPILPLGHSYEFSQMDATLWATCQHDGCDDDVYITLAEAGVGAQILNIDAWASHGFLIPTIYYEGSGTTVYEKSTVAPTGVGTYTASFTFEGFEVSIDFVCSQLDPTEEINIEVPGEKEKMNNGDVLGVNTSTRPITVKWYYDDDEDGLPDDPNNPIGEGVNYVVCCPDSKNPNHDDTGHHIIAEVIQDKDTNGEDLPKDEIIVIYSDSVYAARTLNEVITLINNIGTVEYTDECKDKIDAARRGYDSLSETEQQAVTNYETLTSAENEYAILKANHEAAEAVETLIEAIGEVTLEKEDQIVEAREAYEALTNEQKELVHETVLAELIEAENILQGLKDQAEVDNVEELISSIGEVSFTLDSKQKIDAARKAYDDLSAEQKLLVENYDVLEEAEALYASEGESGSSSVTDQTSGVSIQTDDGTKIPGDISIKVEVKTSVSAQEGSADYEAIQAQLGNDKQINGVYDVKLILTDELGEHEIQPSDIEPGMTITVTMTIPDGVGSEFEILHIHFSNKISYVQSFTVNGNSVSFSLSELSEFAFVTKVNSNVAKTRHGFCGGAVLLIINSLIIVAAGLYVMLRQGFFNKNEKLAKLREKAVLKEILIVFIAACALLANFILDLVFLIVHPCALTIVSFILGTLMCGGIMYWYVKTRMGGEMLPFEEKSIGKLFKKFKKTEDKE